MNAINVREYLNLSTQLFNNGSKRFRNVTRFNDNWSCNSNDFTCYIFYNNENL